jgi:hypothetical protein
MCAIAVAVAVFPQFMLCPSLQQARADDGIGRVTTPDSVVKEIADCLHQRGEYLLDPQDTANRCVEPRTAALESRFVDFDRINCRPATESLPPAGSISSAPVPEGDSFLDHSPPLASTDPLSWPNGPEVAFGGKREAFAQFLRRFAF